MVQILVGLACDGRLRRIGLCLVFNDILMEDNMGTWIKGEAATIILVVLGMALAIAFIAEAVK